MKSEAHLEKPALPDEEPIREDAGASPTVRGVPYKTVLSAVVIGIIAISVLWLLVTHQEGNSATNPLLMKHDSQAQADIEQEESKVTPDGEAYGAIDRRLASMSGRIDRGFQTQQTGHSVVKHELTAMAESLQEIKVAISDLGENSRDLIQRVSEATSRLETIAKEVRTLKVVKRKPIARRKPRPAKTPPFLIDAIDIWDDVTYVAVAQSGRVAFLKPGEQQSGWKVTHIDRLKGQVKFQGPAGQIHSVSLPR